MPDFMIEKVVNISRRRYYSNDAHQSSEVLRKHSLAVLFGSMPYGIPVRRRVGERGPEKNLLEGAKSKKRLLFVDDLLLASFKKRQETVCAPPSNPLRCKAHSPRP